MPDDNVVEFPEAQPSNGNLDVVLFAEAIADYAKNFENHDWQYIVNAVARRLSILEKHKDSGRASEMALTRMEINSLRRSLEMLLLFQGAARQKGTTNP